jgi:hypothetical protein
MDRKIIIKSLSIVIWFSPSYGPLGHLDYAYIHYSNPNFIMWSTFRIDKEISLLRWKLSRGFLQVEFKMNLRFGRHEVVEIKYIFTQGD